MYKKRIWRKSIMEELCHGPKMFVIGAKIGAKIHQIHAGGFFCVCEILPPCASQTNSNPNTDSVQWPTCNNPLAGHHHDGSQRHPKDGVLSEVEHRETCHSLESGLLIASKSCVIPICLILFIIEQLHQQKEYIFVQNTTCLCVICKIKKVVYF